VTDAYRTERIEGWVSDFLGGPRAAGIPSVVREYAPEVLRALLDRACDARGVGPDEVEEADLKAGLLEGVGRLDLPGSVREGVPALAAAFLEDLEEQGRLSGGRALGLYVGALKEAFLRSGTSSPKPFVNPGSKLGRNDPCPCGSGRKYKKCCMQGLGGPGA
jgi:hypothetical protein